jgi:hypothetical protein
MISHVYRMRRTVDQDGFTTRTIHGQATFRTDLLADIPRDADQFVDKMGHPVPPNMQRVRVETSPNEAGNVVDYMIVDTERPTNIQNWTQHNVTRIEAYYKTRCVSHRSADWLADYIGKIDLTRPFTAFTNLRDVMPTTDFMIGIKVWGNRNATRRGLTEVITKVGDAVFKDLAQKFPLGLAVDSSLTEDLMGKFVEAQFAFKAGPISSALNFGQFRVPDPRIGFNDRWNATMDDLANVTSSAVHENPYPPKAGSNKMIGTSDRQLESQEPKDPCFKFGGAPGLPEVWTASGVS